MRRLSELELFVTAFLYNSDDEMIEYMDFQLSSNTYKHGPITTLIEAKVKAE